MKLKTVVIAYKMLDDAVITSVNDKDAVSIIKNRKEMRKHVEAYDALLKDAQEKFKPKNFDEMQEKTRKWNELPESEKEERFPMKEQSNWQRKTSGLCLNWIS